MQFHKNIFAKADVIVTPTTGYSLAPALIAYCCSSKINNRKCSISSLFIKMIQLA